MSEASFEDWPRVGGIAPTWYCASLGELTEVWDLHVEHEKFWRGARTIPSEPLTDLSAALDRVALVSGTSVLVATSTPWTAVYHHPHTAAFGRGLACLAPCAWANIHDDGPEDDGPDAGRGLVYFRAPLSREDVVRYEERCQRNVYIAHEKERVRFYELGERLPFEDADSYKKPRRADRLTADLLLRYASELMLPIANVGTFAGRALLVYRTETDVWPSVEVRRREQSSFVDMCVERIGSAR